METVQSRVRHASIDSRPYGASISSQPENRHHRFPSPHLTDDTFLHVDNWPTQENPTPKSCSFCDRLAGLLDKQRNWIQGHPIPSMIIGIALLLMLLLIATGLVLLFVLQSHPKKLSVVTNDAGLTTSTTSTLEPIREYLSLFDYATFSLPANATQIESLQPWRRHEGYFLAVANQTLLVFTLNEAIRKIHNMTVHSLNIDRKNCSKCHVYDRETIDNAPLYCCTDCPNFSFFCSFYGIENIYHEALADARVFIEPDAVVFHCITEVHIKYITGPNTFLKLHRAVIARNDSVPTMEEGPLQRSYGLTPDSNFSTFAYSSSTQLDWMAVLDVDTLHIRTLNGTNENQCMVSNFFSNDSLSTTALYVESAAKPEDHSTVAAVSDTRFAMARFKATSKRCEYGTEPYAHAPFAMTLLGAAINGKYLLIVHQNSSNVYVQAGGFDWQLPL
ncbi:hypothetical protein QR680_002337 [Steinernema hermaphroditum]|uniref:Uncharacterized protein n=1 Tax=Steinernema hermaphroditum TaxID=289476 RepID=A0AA39H436_9BILA|nr:hypothetical protein QR680_002337 [Steinernema hermaphroditum]